MRQHLQDPVQALERGSSPTSSLSSSSSSDKTKLVFSECFLVTSSWDQQLFSDIACLEASQFWDFLKGFSGYSMVQQPFELAWVQTCSVFNQILVHREISNVLKGTVWSRFLDFFTRQSWCEMWCLQFRIHHEMIIQFQFNQSLLNFTCEWLWFLKDLFKLNSDKCFFQWLHHVTRTQVIESASILKQPVRCCIHLREEYLLTGCWKYHFFNSAFASNVNLEILWCSAKLQVISPMILLANHRMIPKLVQGLLSLTTIW